jgi:signal transduction histidine kinase
VKRANLWHTTTPVPGEVAARLTAAGWSRSAHEGLGVLWVGDDWRGGLAKLSELGDARATTILVGTDPPPGIGTRIRKRGGLGWGAHPLPDWLLVVLEDCLARTCNAPSGTQLEHLVGLDSSAETSVERFEARLARVAGDALGAEAALWRRAPGQQDFTPAGAPNIVPTGLFDSALAQDAPVIVPNTHASRATSPTEGVRAALALVLSRQHTGRDDAVLVLSWREPFLPTVTEVQFLTLFAALGRAILGRLSERTRLVEAHNRHVHALSAMVPPRPDAGPPNVERFIAQVLETHSPDPRLRAIHIRLSAYSRDTPRWVSWWRNDSRPAGAPRVRFSNAPPAEVPEVGAIPDEPVALPDGRWAAVTSIGEQVHGIAIGITDQASAASGVRPSLTDLARDLGLGAILGRWSADTTALMGLSRDQIQAVGPAESLETMLDQVRRRMTADGARLHVVRRGPTGHHLQVLASRPDDEAPEPEDDLHEALAGQCTRLVTAPFTTHLLVPLAIRGHTSAVVEVWRTTPDPFDEDLDGDALQRFAPHIAADARRILHEEVLASRVSRMSSLMQHLNPDLPLHDAAWMAVREIGELVEASSAALLRRAPGEAGAIYVEAVWCADAAMQLTVLAATAAATRELRANALPHGLLWPDEVPDAIRVELAAWGLDTSMTSRLVIPAPAPVGAQPTSAILLLDSVPDDRVPPPFAPDVQDEAATEFAHYLAAVLENATRSCARACADRLSTVPVTPDAITAAAAAILAEVTGAEAVVIALGDWASCRVRTILPSRPSLVGRTLADGAELDGGLLADLATAFGWTAVRSWARKPIDDRGRRLGVILLLSSEDGPTIGWHRRQVLSAVAQRTALELDNAQRRTMLVDLNDVAGRLAGLVGEALADRIVAEVQPWAQAYLRADAQIAVVARVSKDQPLLVTGSEVFDEERLRAVHLASSRWGLVQRRWSPPDTPECFEGLADHGLAVPIQLPENDRLAGHLIVLTRAPFTDDHLAIAAEASRELSVVLDGERIRHGLMAQTGLFRHALLSPVQGLADAAQFLALLARQDDPPDALIAEQRLRVLRECEVIRRWKLIQRLYGGGILGTQITLHKRRQNLRPLVEQCVSRFLSAAQERKIELRVDHDIRGAILLDFDADAVDLILSNLLDNAVKYAFYNRHITVGSYEERANIHLYVEDVGHPLPEDIDVYATGARLDWEDPFRTIHGEGMGLAIARSLARAHGGDLKDRCRPESNTQPPDDTRDDTRPYKVRFTLTLPKASR